MAVENLQAVLRSQRQARAQTGITIANGLQSCANILLKESQKLVPVENGDLKATGHTEVSGSGFSTTALVVYGGVAPSGKLVDYAYFVHEDLEKYHEPPTQARYLADAIPACRGRMVKALGRQLTAGTTSRTEE